MKVQIEYSSSLESEKSRTEIINTLDDLVSLMNQEKNPLILHRQLDDGYEDCDFRIEVYDGYRE